MIPSIDVFFEFSSPYSYLAAQELPALAARHGRPLRWRPIELAKVWGAQGVLKRLRGRAAGEEGLHHARRGPRGGRPKPQLRSVSIPAGCSSGTYCCSSTEPTRADSGRAFRAGDLAQAIC